MAETSEVRTKPTVVTHTVAKATPKIDKKDKLVPMVQGACQDAALSKPVSYAERKVAYVDEQLMKSCSDLSAAKTPKEKEKIEAKIKELQVKKQTQKETAQFKELRDGRLRMTLSKDVSVKDLQERFDLQDGTFGAEDKSKWTYQFKDYDDEQRKLEAKQYKYYGNHVLKKGESFVIEPNKINNQGMFQEFWNALTGH